MAASLTRRHVLAGLTGIGASTALTPKAFAETRAGIVVIGGGFGGAMAAIMLQRLLPQASITLIEPNAHYIACPLSNLIITGKRELADQTFTYENVASTGVKLVQARAADIDTGTRTVILEDGSGIPYDRAILSPGIEMRWGALEGYNEAAAEHMPHAWKAGAQTDLLRQQLAAMEDGGLVVISVPSAPYRCPPGPYERASLVAHYLKTQKPRSKLLILDAKDSFSKRPLFQRAWAETYSDLLEWRSASNDGRVSRVDPDTMTLMTDFETIHAGVINIIPPQKAALIAERAGVADMTGWCPINPVSFESTLQPGLHVIGDATIATPMPKSAFSAHLQAKICAIQVARLLSGLEPIATVLSNTCYSYTSPDTAISITGVYRNDASGFMSVPGAGGLSPSDASDEDSRHEAALAHDWFRTITTEVFG